MNNLKIKVGNDNGNSQQKISIQDQVGVEVIVQPNVIKNIRRMPVVEKDPLEILKNYNNILATIKSNSINNNVPTTYYIGNAAINCGRIIDTIPVGAVNSKLQSPIPVVNTLGIIGFYSVKKKAEEYGWSDVPTEINVDVDMATALPVTQYNKTTALEFSKKFSGVHEVIIWISEREFKVNINFEFVKTNPESVPLLFALEDRQNNFDEWEFYGMKRPTSFNKFIETWEEENQISINLINGTNAKLLHLSIGEGTTEIPLTKGLMFDPNFTFGSNNGIGHAIDAALPLFMGFCNLAKLTRQDFSKILLDNNHKYNPKAWDCVDEYFEEQTVVICSNAAKEIGRANNEVDIVCAHGGGALMLDEYLRPELAKLQVLYGVKTLILPKGLASIGESVGSLAFINSPIWAKIKAEKGL